MPPYANRSSTAVFVLLYEGLLSYESDALFIVLIVPSNKP